MLPLVLLAGGIGALLCSFSAGRLADHLGNGTAGTLAAIAVIVVLGAYFSLQYLPAPLVLPVLLVTSALQAYTVWGFSIAVQSQIAHLAPSSVPVAISLNMAAFNVGMAIAAAVGGIVVDSFGGGALPVAALPPVLAAIAVWRLIPNPPRA